MSGPNRHQLNILSQAVAHVAQGDVDKYMELKELFRTKDGAKQAKFRSAFERYYGLYSGGVTSAWRDRFFQLLYELELRDRVDPYTPILRALYEIPRHKGDRELHFSFTSKLVAIHDESYPLYDRHVSAFFGIVPPSLGGVDFRIAGFVSHMRWLRQTYSAWERDDAFLQVVGCLRDRYPCLQVIATPRLADMLVWAAGKCRLDCTLESEQQS